MAYVYEMLVCALASPLQPLCSDLGESIWKINVIQDIDHGTLIRRWINWSAEIDYWGIWYEDPTIRAPPMVSLSQTLDSTLTAHGKAEMSRTWGSVSLGNFPPTILTCNPTSVFGNHTPLSMCRSYLRIITLAECAEEIGSSYVWNKWSDRGVCLYQSAWFEGK